MTLPNWLSPLARKLRSTRKQTTPRRIRPRDLSVESLEGRLVPATFTVNLGLPAVGSNFHTIQAAINNGTTHDGDVIKVAPGTYTEAINVDKAVKLEGAQFGNDANARFAAFTPGANGPKADPSVESIITSPISTLNNLVSVTDSGVTIDGFVIDGNNPNLAPSGTLVSGINVDANEGIINQDSGLNDVAIGTLTVKNNIVQNFAFDSIELANADPFHIGAITTGSLIQGNVVGNFVNDGIGLSNNFYATVKNNTVNVIAGDIFAGIDIQNYNTGGGSVLVTGNTVTVGADSLGIFSNLLYAPGFTETIQNNTIQAAAGVTGDDGFTWGVAIFSVQNTAQVTENGDTIGTTGGQFARGTYVWNAGTSHVTLKNLVIGSNSVAPVVGIDLEGVDGFYGASPGETVALTNDTVIASTYGVQVLDEVQATPPGGGANFVEGSVEADISGGTYTGGTADVYVEAPLASSPYTGGVSIAGTPMLTGGGIGLELNGAQAIAVGNTLGNTVFTGQTGDYITLANDAEMGQTINATNSTFDGIKGKQATPTQAFAIEAKITDLLDDSTLGFVRINPNAFFATPGTGLQAAIDASSPGDTIYIAPGTYADPVDVDVANLKFIALGDVDITGPVTLDKTTTFTSQGDLDFSGGINLNGFNLTLNATGANTIDVDTSPITGAGNITINNGVGPFGTVGFDVTDTYAGNTTVNGGELDLDASGGDAIPGNVVINAGTVKLLADEQIVSTANVTVKSGALFDLGGNTQTLDPLTLNGGTTDLAGGVLNLAGAVTAGGPATTSTIEDTVGGGFINLDGPTTVTVANGDTLNVLVPIQVTTGGTLLSNGAGALNLDGLVSLDTPTTFTSTKGTLTLAGGVDVAGQAFTLNAAAGKTINVPGVVADSVGGGTVTLNNTATAGTILYNGAFANTFAGTTTLDKGELDLDDAVTNGAIVGPLVINGGVVKDLLPEQILDSVDVTVNAGAKLNLNGNTETLDPLTLNGGTTDLAGGILILSGDVDAGGPAGTTSSITDTVGGGHIDLDGATRSFTVATGDELDIKVPITGTGGVTAVGPGTVVMQASVANTYTGTTTVLDGTLKLNSTAVAIPGPLVIGDGIGAVNSAVVNALKSNVIAGSSVVTINSDGELLLTTNQSIAGLVGSGNVVGTGLLNLTVPSGVTDTFSGVISGSGFKLTKNGPGTQVLSGMNTYTGATAINAGELEVDGMIGPGPVAVNSGGILGGTGSVNATVNVNNGGEIDPGTAGGGVGTLNAQNVTFKSGSIYHVDLGVTPLGGVANDFLNGGTFTIKPGAQLQLAPTFCAFNGTALDIMHSTVAYGGVFSVGATPLTEGGTFLIGGSFWKITYVGAPGHDIILTHNSTVDTWTGAGNNNLWSNPNNWSLGVPVAGEALLFPVTAQQKYNVNDLPVGFRVGEIDLVGSGYGISGNAIVLDAGIQDSAPPSDQFGLNVTLDCDTIWTTSSNATMVDTGSINTAGFTLYLNDTLAGSGTMLAGAITGAGSVVKTGIGSATFSGAASNTYTGKTIVNTGTLNLNKANPATAIAGKLIIGDGIGGPNADVVNITFDNQISDTVPITVNSSGKLNFGTSTDTIGDLRLNGGSVVVGAISGAINLAGNLTVTQSTTIGEKINLIGAGPHVFRVTNGQTLIVSGQINGVGASLTKTGRGTLTFTGSTENLYTGTTTVVGGTLNLSKTSNAIAVAGPLVVSSGLHHATVNFTGPNQVGDAQPITVNAKGTVNMNSFSDEVGAINLNGGTLAIGPTGTLTINGDITTTGNSKITGGTLYIKEVTRTVSVAAGGTLTLDAAVTSIFNAGLIKTGPGTLVLGGSSTFTGPTTISSGTLQLKGGAVPGPLTIAPGAALAGSGSTGPLTLSSGSEFDVSVNAGGSNMVSATGDIDLDGATLNVDLGTLPAVNQTFTILSSTTAINGTFAGLPNNSTFVVGGHTFQITYSAFNTVFLTFLG